MQAMAGCTTSQVQLISFVQEMPALENVALGKNGKSGSCPGTLVFECNPPVLIHMIFQNELAELFYLYHYTAGNSCLESVSIPRLMHMEKPDC